MRICLKSSLLPLPNQDVCRSLRIFIGPFDATPHPIGSLGSGAHNAVLVPLQRMRLDRQGRPRNLRYRNPMGPGIGRYGNVAGIASRTALGLCKPDHDECPRRGNLSECRRARDAKRDIPVPLSPCARATTCTCRGRPAPGPRLRHFAPPPDPYDEWLDGVSDALASGLRQLRDLRPLRHFGQPLAPTPTADYPPRASRFPGGQRSRLATPSAWAK